MTTFRDLVASIRAGQRPVVTFTDAIEESDGYAEGGMRARAISADIKHDECADITFDFSEFESHNLPFERANWYDKNQQPTLTARQAGKYKPQEGYYFDLGADVAGHLSIESDARLALYAKYRESGSALPYVAWLEDQVLAAGGA